MGENFAATQVEIATLRDLLRFGREELAPHFRVDGDPDHRALVVAFFARATTTLEALALLLDDGYGQQAMMLNRAAFELIVDTWWIIGHEDEAERRFVEHARYSQHLKRELAGRYSEWFEMPPTDPTGLDAAELKKLSSDYRHGTKHWTTLSTYERVEQVAAGLDRAEDREQLRSFRNIVHKLQNEELHPTSWSIGRALKRRSDPERGEVLQYRTGPEPELGQVALRSAWWMYLQLVVVVGELFEAPIEAGLDALVAEAPWADER